ncbi:MAG: hypothetical protein QOG58_1685 [Caballeronia sp.]|nr:hypothetical protein [Caballeronia sp.]
MSLIFLSIVAVFIVVIAGLVAFTQYIAHRVERALPPQGRFIDLAAYDRSRPIANWSYAAFP